MEKEMGPCLNCGDEGDPRLFVGEGGLRIVMCSICCSAYGHAPSEELAIARWNDCNQANSGYIHKRMIFLKRAVAAVRRKHGRDGIRRLAWGTTLDALDAGRDSLHPDDLELAWLAHCREKGIDPSVMLVPMTGEQSLRVTACIRTALTIGKDLLEREYIDGMWEVINVITGAHQGHASRRKFSTVQMDRQSS